MVRLHIKKNLEEKLPELADFPNIAKYINGLSTEYYDYPKKIKKNLLDELLQIEHEKFLPIRYEGSINADTGEVMGLLSNYLNDANGIECLTVGLPGAGKTTFAKKYFSEELIFNWDNECYELLAANKGNFEVEWNYSKIIELSLEHRLNKKSVVLDALSITKNSRKKMANNRLRFCILFDTGVETCYYRMKKRKDEGINQIFELADLVHFLFALEFPIIKESASPEFDLSFIINSKSELSKIHPLDYFNKIFKSNYH